MKSCISICLQVVLVGGLLASVAQQLDPEVLLDKYNSCNKKFETIFYELETTTHYGGLRPGKRVHSFQYCSDKGKKQWIGQMTRYNEDGTIEQRSSGILRDIYNDRWGIHLQFYNPQWKSNRPPNAYLFRNSRRDKAFQDYSETPTYGGSLTGRLFGSNGQSVFDLLKTATNPKLHKKAAKIIGHDTYLIEADTKYGNVKAWISPNLDYNCLKWEIIKGPDQFYRDGAFVNDGFTKLTAAYLAEKVDQIDGQLIITRAGLNYKVEDGEKVLSNSTYHFNLTNIDFNPDFAALGAFEIQLPEGTVVRDEDNPEIRYQWTGGLLVTGNTKTKIQDTAEVEIPAAKPARTESPEDLELLNIYKKNVTKHIQYLASLESRHITHPGNKKAEEYIFSELKKYGYSPVTDSFQARNMTLHNVISDSSDKNKPIILLSAHFDSTAAINGKLSSQAPGADDNASGVAALLELARILKENRIEKNFEFVFFNCEEVGTIGSKHLSGKYRDNGWQIDYMINLDTIGTWDGPLSETCPVNYVTDKNSAGIVKKLQEKFPYPLRKAKTMWRDDHGNFWDKGYKAIEITEDDCTKHMHKPTDTPEKLNYDNIARIVHGLYLFLSK